MRRSVINVKKQPKVIRVSAPKGTRIAVTHKATTHNPITFTIGRKHGISIRYQRQKDYNARER